MNVPHPLSLAIATLLCFSTLHAPAALDGEGEVKLFKPGKENPEELVKVAQRHKDDRVAATALGMVLRANKASSLSQDTLNLLATFAERPQGRDRAAVIIASMKMDHAIAQEWVDSLASHKSPGARSLAAATVTARNQLALLNNATLYPRAGNDYLNRSKNRTPAPEGKLTKRQQQRAAKKAKDAQHAGPKPFELSDALYADTDAGVALLALVAGAYEGNPAHADAVAASKATGPQAAGARLLYAARAKQWPESGAVQKMFKAAMATPRGAAQRPRGSSRIAPFPWTALPPGGALACLALGQSGQAATAPLLRSGLRHGELPVRMEAIRALRSLKVAEALPDFANLVKTCSWPEVVEICAFVRAQPDKRIMPNLIRRLGNEQGRLRLDLVYTLSALAGGAHASDAPGWIAWWKAHGANLTIDATTVQAWIRENGVETLEVRPRGFFYGLPIHSDRFVYTLDSSGKFGNQKD